MANSKRYNVNIEQRDNGWLAQIIRQVTSTKMHITKEKVGFASEAEAKEWAELELAQFSATLRDRNRRHAEQRTLNEEIRRQRSDRRAKKTAKAKSEALQLAPTDLGETD